MLKDISIVWPAGSIPLPRLMARPGSVLGVPDSHYLFYFCRRLTVSRASLSNSSRFLTSVAKPATTSHSAASVRSFSTLACKSFKAGPRRAATNYMCSGS